MTSQQLQQFFEKIWDEITDAELTVNEVFLIIKTLQEQVSSLKLNKINKKNPPFKEGTQNK